MRSVEEKNLYNIEIILFNNMNKSNSIYLDMSLFDLSILDVLPQVVADGSEGGVHLYTEVTPESYGSFIFSAFLFIGKE